MTKYLNLKINFFKIQIYFSILIYISKFILIKMLTKVKYTLNI